MPSKSFPLAYLAGKRLRAPNSARNAWDNWINARQVAALLHIPENRVYRLSGMHVLPVAHEHQPSKRLLWWPADVVTAAERLPKNEVPQWLDEATVADWLKVAVPRLERLVAHDHLPGPSREWRGTFFWRPAEIREAVDTLPGGFACTFDGL